MVEEQEILHDAESYRALLDQSLTGIFILTDDRIRWANQTMVKILGYRVEELAERDAWRIVHPDDRERVRQAALERLAGMRTSEVYEARLLRKDGRTIWAEVRATPIAFQGQPAVLTNIVNITHRKQAERALQQSEARFRTLYENAPIGIYRLGLDGSLLMANPAFVRMLGYDGPDDAAALAALNREAFEPTFPHSEFKILMTRNGVVRGLESAWIRRDESLLYARENALTVCAPDGEPLYYEGTVEDITRQKLASQELALYAKRLQAKREVDQAILAARSPDEVVRAVATRVRGLVPCQRTSVVLIEPDRKRAKVIAVEADESWQEIAQEGSVWPVEVLVPRPLLEGDSMWRFSDIDEIEAPGELLERLRDQGIRSGLSVALMFDRQLAGALNLTSTEPSAFDAEQHKVVRSLANQLAIALHQAQLRSALAQERQRLHTLLEHLPDGVLLLDADGKLELANPTARDYLTELSSTAPGQPLFRLGDRLLSDLCDGDDGAAGVEVNGLGPSGRVFEVTCRPVRAEFKPSGWAIMLREVTAERWAQQQLQQQERQATVGALAGGVAHDFNNLITAIEGCAWMLMRRLSPEDPLRRPAKEIRETCDRAGALCRQLVQFSRSRALELSKVDVNNVVGAMGQMLDRLMGSRIIVETRLGLHVDPVLADAGQLEQVVVNLALNAREAMKMGGKLTIETSSMILNDIDPSWPGGLEPGNYVRLAVVDTGEGMDTETQQRVFEPFFTTRTQTGGTGLGLSTVKGIVTQSSGHVRVQSAPGKGTTFEILLPCAD